MRASIFVIPFAVAALASPHAAAAGWKTFTDHAKKCQASAPANWVPGEYNIGMNDPSGASSVIISNSSSTDLAFAKQVASSTFSVQKTMTDSPSRYWMAYADNTGKHLTNWYEAVAVGGYTCTMQLTFDAHLSDADAKTIATSLKKN
jgi:hypothetical protein